MNKHYCYVKGKEVHYLSGKKGKMFSHNFSKNRQYIKRWNYNYYLSINVFSIDNVFYYIFL